MKLTTKHLAEIILAVVAIMLVVGIVLVLATPIGNFFTGVLDKEKEPVNDNIFQTGTYDIPFTVSLKKNIAEAGTVEFTGDHSGTSINMDGAGTVTFKATVNSGYKFLGWYQGDTLISEDLEYTAGYAVSGGTTITAKYKVGMAAGLYETGTTTMLMSWDDLIDNGILSSSGAIVSGQEANLAGDLVISDTLTSVPNYAYKNCTELTGVTIPESVSTIYSSFSNCSKLKTVYYEGTLEQWCNIKIPSTSASPCYNKAILYVDGKLVKDITIPDSVTTIGSNTFYGCTSLESITIPNGVTQIGNYAFNACANLKTVYYEGTLEQWCNIKFNESANPCYNGADLYINNALVTDITIPNSITTIKGYSFQGCTSLKSVIIPNSVTTIGNYAFYNCQALESVTIPDSVTSIGSGAFKGCAFTSIVLPDSVTSISSGAFKDCASLTSIALPNNITSISGNMFSGCKALGGIMIPDSVTTIGGGAFEFCTNLTSITIPVNVTSIGASTFRDCNNLTKVTVLATTPPSINTVTNMSGGTFYGCTALTTITVPKGTLSAYQTAWSSVASKLVEASA